MLITGNNYPYTENKDRKTTNNNHDNCQCS